MKSKFKINFPKKSIFGFKILTSIQSTIACYLLLLYGKIFNPFFGSTKIQLIAGSLFNFSLNITIVILIINLLIKRIELKKNNFIFLNFLLFIYLPIALHIIFSEINRIILFLRLENNMLNLT